MRRRATGASITHLIALSTRRPTTLAILTAFVLIATLFVFVIHT
jgi:hypothetical protein